MIGWKEQEPETELSIKHLKLSITVLIVLKLVATYFGMWAKTSSFNISQFSRYQDIPPHLS